MSSLALETAVFDLDGVVTRTARVHFAAWKQLFDELLARIAPPLGPSRTADHRPFEERDYRVHVDGRPRLDGVMGFLASRGISLPLGRADDSPDALTIRGLGNRKNALFLERIEAMGVDVDPAAVELLHSLRAAGVRIGMASSSRNASMLLRRAQIEGLFDARVDGAVSAELGLRGKPHPDAILECLRLLDCSTPERAVLFEDATAGVAAGRAGGLGLVVGVDRGDNGVGLKEAGADWVVRDLGEVSVERLCHYVEVSAQARRTGLDVGALLDRSASPDREVSR